jgi:hypothetical protein
MAKLTIKKASTSIPLYVFVQDSSVTTGAGLTGLAYNTASLVASYVRPLAARSAITLATQTVTGAFSSGGFVEVDATNTPGLYRFDIPDAAIATGVNSVVIMLKGAANMVPVVLEVDLVAYDPQDTVRLGLTAMPNAAANAAGGLPISTAGALNLDGMAQQISNIAAVGTLVNVVAESYVLTTGTQTSGTYASTALLDATPHTHTDTAGTLDLYYQFDIGVQGLPSAVGITAYSNGASDDVSIQAYNWVSSAWQTVGTIIGKSGSTYDTGTYTLFTGHVGTGANIGKVRIRFYSAALTSATLRVDQIFVSYSTGQEYQYTAGVVQDATATTTVFKTNLTQVSNFWNDGLLIFTSGALSGQFKPILSYSGTNGTITLDEALTSAPVDGVAFVIKATHIHPITQIQSGLALEATAQSILTDTTEIGVAGAGLTNINLPDQTMNITGSLSGSVGSVTGAVGSVTGAVGSVTARVTANADQINGVATAAARLALSTQGIVTGTVGDASSTTSIVTSAIDPAAAVIDQFKGRIVIFSQGTTTANLRGQATDITASTALGVLTVTALTTAPVSGDTFTIV